MLLLKKKRQKKKKKKNMAVHILTQGINLYTQTSFFERSIRN
jgi:hypothetical protein